MSFELNPKEVPLEELLRHKIAIKKYGDYSRGGFYMIKDKVNSKSYIGKSVYPESRLKNHISHAQRGTGLLIDKSMQNRLHDFEFYILLHYSQVGIDFFSRKLEGVIEQKLISQFNTGYPSGYNIRVYEHI